MEHPMALWCSVPMATITADLTTGYSVDITNGRHTWKADEPLDLGGTDTGPNPYEMMLGSLAACTAITLSMYAQRKGIALDSISAQFTYDKIHADDCAHCDDEAQGFLHNVTSEIFIDGDLDDTQRARLQEVAQRCPVHKTLAAGLVFDETVTF